MSRSRGLSISTCETIQKFIEASTEEEAAVIRESFERQADLMRRHGKDESAAFWDALANGMADAAGGTDRRTGEALPKRDVA